MRVRASILLGCCLLLPPAGPPAEGAATEGAAAAAAAVTAAAAADFDAFLKPVLAAHCTKCHGDKKKVKGKVNLAEITTAGQFLTRPGLIKEMIDVIDARDMPPEDEPELGGADREKLLATLKVFLRQSTAAAGGGAADRVPVRRLNRFQYNNAVRDLFALNRDVFALPEKLMTRHSNYLGSIGASPGRMPEQVEVACHALGPAPGMAGVRAFPKDLRASHGYDNQANQLSLSPLLLDAFLKLSVSIVESPDFNPGTVGLWGAFFGAPAEGTDLSSEVLGRLRPFLRRAFRRDPDKATLGRYTAYALGQIRRGLPFTESMKKVASAALSSPLFLLRYEAPGDGRDLHALASDLSFTLWGSLPDDELLRLSGSGDLARADVLDHTLARMLADPKVERFLDTFPAQWMQLENVLAATPDPGRARLFTLDKTRPASVQMVLEPLLLFDAIFIEDRPIDAFIAPDFSYQSEFLRDWYQTDLQPEPIDEAAVAEENQARETRLQSLRANLQDARDELEAHRRGAVAFLAEKSEGFDLAPGYKRWEAAQAELVADSVVLTNWARIGPFAAGNFDQAHAKPFIDPSDVDLERKHGKLRWEEAEHFVDGKVHTLTGANCATYLFRRIESDTARSLEVSLGSDDSFKLWLNGALVADKKITRGVAPDQDKVRLDLVRGGNELLFKVCNGGGGYGFYFKAQPVELPGPVIAALKVKSRRRTREQWDTLGDFYRTIAPELAPARKAFAAGTTDLERRVKKADDDLKNAPKPQGLAQHRQEAQRRFDQRVREKLGSRSFRRVAAADPRFGGVITNAAMLSMTSGPKRTHPIARGAWVIEVILNDPPPPPPNDVPPLNEEESADHLTIREKFAVHRKNPDCAGCHSRLDPLGFALENFDITGRWRDRYDNGRDVDPGGTLMQRHRFGGVVEFKASLLRERRRFAKAFTGHLLRFALSRELVPADVLAVEAIVERAEPGGFKLRTLIREVVLSEPFLRLE